MSTGWIFSTWYFRTVKRYRVPVAVLQLTYTIFGLHLQQFVHQFFVHTCRGGSVITTSGFPCSAKRISGARSCDIAREEPGMINIIQRRVFPGVFNGIFHYFHRSPWPRRLQRYPNTPRCRGTGRYSFRAGKPGKIPGPSYSFWPAGIGLKRMISD